MSDFQEVQRFTQPWIWLIVIANTLLIWIFAFLMLSGLILSESAASPRLTGLVFLLCGIVVPAMFLLCKLKTTVSKNGISISFRPFHSTERVFTFQEIRSIEARQYRPIAEYGGWGLRRGPSGKAYNISGNQGIQLVLNNGEKILIGTQRPQEFLQAVKKANT